MSRRFRLDHIDPDASGRIDLQPALRHLQVVRTAVGDHVLLFDGAGNEVEAEVVRIDGEGAEAEVRRRVDRRTESPFECWLVQAIPVRVRRMDGIVRQVTELGVCRIVPLLATRSQQTHVDAEALERRVTRWRRIAESAAEQCRRAVVPSIDLPVRFGELDWSAVPEPIFIADPGAGGYDDGDSRERSGRAGGEPGEGGHRDGEETAVPGPEPPPAAAVLVGPEGGWTAAEVDAALAAGGRLLRLGPRVLRADTAGVVAVALLQWRWGDLAP